MSLRWTVYVSRRYMPYPGRPGTCTVCEAPLRARPGLSTFWEVTQESRYSLNGIFFHDKVHVYALGQWAETRANMPRHVRVHVVVNICERPLGQWAESRCWRRAVHDQPCVRCSRVAFRRVMREYIQCSRAAHRILDVARRMISHVCDVVVAPVTFWRRSAQKQSWRLSHCWCRDRCVYCRIAVRHSKVQTVSA